MVYRLKTLFLSGNVVIFVVTKGLTIRFVFLRNRLQMKEIELNCCPLKMKLCCAIIKKITFNKIKLVIITCVIICLIFQLCNAVWQKIDTVKMMH